MSSSDGFCSSISFTPGELGQLYNGPVPTAHHPSLAISTTNSAQPSPMPTPTAPTAPSMSKQPSSSIVPSPSPVSVARPPSPTRSNSTSSIATQSSHMQGPITSNPTPTLGNVPSVAATNSISTGFRLTTPPLTPMSGGVSAASSVSGSVLGKRDPGAASESEREDYTGVQKKRRIAPTLVSSTEGPPSGT